MKDCMCGYWTEDSQRYVPCPGALIEQWGDGAYGKYLYWVCSDCAWVHGPCGYCSTPWPYCECGDLGCNLMSHERDCKKTARA